MLHFGAAMKPYCTLALRAVPSRVAHIASSTEFIDMFQSPAGEQKQRGLLFFV